MLYHPPRHAIFTPRGSVLQYPVLVLESKQAFGHTDYRIAMSEQDGISQWIRPNGESITLTFTEEA